MAQEWQDRRRVMQAEADPMEHSLPAVWFWRFIGRAGSAHALVVAIVVWMLDRQLLGGHGILAGICGAAGMAVVVWACLRWRKVRLARQMAKRPGRVARDGEEE